MGFSRTYLALQQMVKGALLETQMARAIIRKSGFISGSGPMLPEGASAWDGLKKNSAEDFDADWFTLFKYLAYGEPTALIHHVTLRNMDAHAEPTFPDVSAPISEEFCRWDDVPAGTHYHPLGADWWVTKSDLSRAEQIRVQINNFAAIDAALHVGYHTASTYNGASWNLLASVELDSTGLLVGDWMDLPEEARADVWTALLLVANSPVSTFHSYNAKAEVRFFPRSKHINPL